MGQSQAIQRLLAPIRGFLHKNLGRAWDDVWSEISAHLSGGSTTQRHVLGHVFDFVEIHAIEQADGSITNSVGRALRGFRLGGYYVHPETGLLCQVARVARPRARPFRQQFPLVPYHRLDGVWYEVRFDRLRELPAFDVVFKELASGKHHHAPGRHWRDGGVFYCASKRQAGKREIKRFALRAIASDHAGATLETA